MSEAFLMLEDRDNTIALHAEFTGGFNAASPAHRHLQLLIKAMNTLAQRVPESEPLPSAITVARFNEAIAAQEAKAIADGTAQRMVPEA